MTRPLAGRVVIVAGGADPMSLGYLMSGALLRAGASVAVLDVSESALGQSVPTLQARAGTKRVSGFVADVSNRSSVDRAVAGVVQHFGQVHMLINSAGVYQTSFGTPAANTWSIEPSVWNRMISVNLTGAFNLVRAVVPRLVHQGWGRVVGVTTSLSSMYQGLSPPYGPSKAGHEALIAALAEELDRTGVTANVLVPGGPTRTRMTVDNPQLDGIPMIEPEVMAAPAVWLASDESGEFNGRRVIACLWDPAAPLAARLDAATAPAAWPQAGQAALRPGGEAFRLGR
jgi:NAD(P)-dependent dehydrogenase (short-subunit alcohol dehydrogenase family)